MNCVWGTLTIGASPVRIATSKLKVCKLSFQSAPGNQGNVKIGSSTMTTADNTTPGTFLSPSTTTNPDASESAGDMWSVETDDSNTLDASAFYVHGTNAGDLVMYSYHVG